MSNSRAQMVAESAHASLPQVVSEPPTSSSLAQVGPFSPQSRQAFRLMLDSRKDIARERVTDLEKQKYIKWLTEIIPERLGVAEGKKRSWVKSDFIYEHGKLWKLPGRLYKQQREVISEDAICDTIIRVHLNLSHAGQRATGIKVKNEYYGASDSEVTFLVKLCGICRLRWKGSRFSGEGDDVYAPTQGSNRKRIAYQQPEALHTTPKSTRHGNKSGDSGIIVINNEGSDASSASVSRNRPRRSPAIKVEDTFSSPLNTQTSRPANNGVRDLDILEDSDNDQSLSSLNEDLLRATTETSHRHSPGFDASYHNHNRETARPTTQDGSVIEEQDPPSLSIPITSSTPTRQQSRNAPKPEVQIQYFIITARTPRLAYTLWPDGTLRDKTIDQIFNNVAPYISYKRAQKIIFKLCTSQVEMEYPIRRGDGNTFEDMRRAFNEGLKVDRKKGVTRFQIWLEPDAERQALVEGGDVEGLETEDDIIV